MNDKSNDPNDRKGSEVSGDNYSAGSSGPGPAGVSHDEIRRAIKDDEALKSAGLSISCSQLDTAIGVLQMVQSGANVWIRMGVSTVLALLQGFKATKGCP